MRGIIIVVACLLAAGSAGGGRAVRDPGSGEHGRSSRTPSDWDGRIVGFTGEAIGEAMRRGTMAWIHLNDDAYGLAEAGATHAARRASTAASACGWTRTMRR